MIQKDKNLDRINRIYRIKYKILWTGLTGFAEFKKEPDVPIQRAHVVIPAQAGIQFWV
jgi:hypothetical protein